MADDSAIHGLKRAYGQCLTVPRASLTSRVANSQDRAEKLTLKFMRSNSPDPLLSTTMLDLGSVVRYELSSCRQDYKSPHMYQAAKCQNDDAATGLEAPTHWQPHASAN